MIGANLGPLFDAADVDRLKPQTQGVLRVLKERGSITRREARELVGTDNLPARILEIRSAFGDASVETTREPNKNGGHHARYVWRGRAS